MKKKAVVIGAGIQGTLTAVLLAKKGYHVQIIDKSSTILNRASRVNEGKIHLGLIWANDPSFSTASYMLKSALTFGPITEELFDEKLPWNEWLSLPFDYVSMNDSMLDKRQLEAFYGQLESEYNSVYKNSGLHYLGTKPEWIAKEKKSVPSFLNKAKVQAIWNTTEYSLDVLKFNNYIRNKVNANPSISIQSDTTVCNIQQNSFGYRIEAVFNNQIHYFDSEVVINCSWEGRLELDKKISFENNHSWIYRLKHAIHAKLPTTLQAIPSLTFVLGAYGDIVNFGNKNKAYISWYPEGMLHTTEELTTPKSWENICEGNNELNPELLKIRNGILQEFSKIVFDLEKASEITLDAGIIYSKGDKEITNPKSEVHKRFQVGIMHNRDGYFSIDTGKYTCAPLHVQLLENQI